MKSLPAPPGIDPTAAALAAAQAAVDGRTGKGAGQHAGGGKQPRWASGMNKLPDDGKHGVPKSFFMEYYAFQEANTSVSPVNPGNLKSTRRCVFTDVAQVPGYQAFLACCPGKGKSHARCTFKHPGERVPGKDGRADVTMPAFPLLAMQNMLAKHAVPTKPKP
jgi:hypothetical protein